MRILRTLAFSLVAATLCLAASALPSATVSLGYLSSGVADLVGGFRQQALQLSSVKPSSLKTIPAGIKDALYGILPIGPDRASGSDQATSGRKYHVIVDEAEYYSVLSEDPDDDAILGINAKRPRIFVDYEGNGNMAQAKALAWDAYPMGKYSAFVGGSSLKIWDGQKSLDIRIGMYRYDRRDPDYSADAKTLYYFRDYGYKGTLTLDGVKYPCILSDEAALGDFRGAIGKENRGVFLLIDLNGDGVYRSPNEYFDIGKPFNLDGRTTWEIVDMSPLGDIFRIVKSQKTVTQTLAPADLRVGKKAPSFVGTDIAGKKLSFPSDYKGKIVLLDFWASWCGPCMEELPGIVSAYKKYRDKGFDILSVSLDDDLAAALAAIKSMAMPWRGICDGKGWDADIAALYLIESIPAPFLIDGDTGAILAIGDELRGDSLDGAISRALSGKFSK